MRYIPSRLAALALTVSVAASLSTAGAAPQSYGIDTPTAIGPYLNGVFPDQPPGAANTYTPVEAYTSFSFNQPLKIVAEPNGNRLFVATRDGRFYHFVDTPNASQITAFADLRDRVAEVWDGGMLGLAFHPEFGLAGSTHEDEVFLYYCYTPTGNYPTQSTNGFYDCYLRLSRFRVVNNGQTLDPASEQVMIQHRLYNGSHRGGDIQFGPDGFLYVPIGDQFRYTTAQNLQSNLEGGVLRLDVDQDPSRSHAPLRRMPLQFSDELSGAGYWIPNDNPFPSATGATFEEYWSIGHRAPHRMTFDSFTGDLYIGEVGGGRREEINIVERGGNYGWPFREGLTTGPNNPPGTIIGNLTDPIVDFTRSEAFAIIGGFVYRGSTHTNLFGKYICADYGTSRMFAIYPDPVTGDWQKDVIGTFSPNEPITFGENHAGELVIGRQAGNTRLYTLAATNPSPDPPALLSQIGAFANLQTLEAAPGFVPYNLNVPFWSDEAIKTRWVAIPNDGAHDTPAEQVGFDKRSGNWTFPEGSVTMKHFELGVDDTDPSVTRRLETRFVVFTDDDYYTVSYHWLPDGSDAILATTRVDEIIEIATDGEPRYQTWTFPGRQDCRVCHDPATEGSLGLRTHQLNGDLDYPVSGVTDNQLRTWAHLGIFGSALDEAEIPNLAAAAPMDDPNASIELKARSYLDSNCAGCHRYDAATRAVFDVRFDTPLYSSSLLFGTVSDDLGIGGSHVILPREPDRSISYVRADALGGRAMPPVGKNLVDDEGVQLLREWIRDLDPSPPGNVGNEVGERPWTDGWAHVMVINETDVYSNVGLLPYDVRPEAFRFEAHSIGSPITPFLVKVLGDDTFEVLAIGDTIEPGEYRVGTNMFPFSEDVQRFELRPGDTIASGFLDAFPDGSGGALGSVVPFCFCNDADEIWYSGGPFAGQSASLTIGMPPTPGAQTVTTHVREYPFSIDFAIEEFNTPPSFGSLPPVSMVEGEETSFTVMASDGQNDIVIYGARGLPDGLTIDPETGEISGAVGLVSEGTYPVTVTASDGRTVGSGVFDLTVTPQPYTTIYLSFEDQEVLPGGVVVGPEDVVAYDLVTGGWSTFFDGSSHGISSGVEGLHVMANGDVLLAFKARMNLPGLLGGPAGTALEPQDVVRFRPSNGTFSFHMDGSDLFFLEGPGMRIDGLGERPDGRLVLSTASRTTIGGLPVRDEDVSALIGTAGAQTVARFEMTFDGSDVGLGQRTEDVDALCFVPGGDMLVSTTGSARVPGPLELEGGDVSIFSGAFGSGTSGSFRGFLRAALEGIPGADVTALHVD